MSKIEQAYELAKEAYAEYGVDTDKAMEMMDEIAISFHCWQMDDVTGLEGTDQELSGGIQTTGNYPGAATNFDQLTADLSKSLSYVPGRNKVNLHAMYLDNGGVKVDRDEIEPKHFDSWVQWANEHGVGLDFNPTFFSHPLSENGTLSSSDEGVRDFWIEHGIRSRKISEYLGKKTGQKSLNNIWIPDGDKEFPVDTWGPRERFADSLDRMIAGYKVDSKFQLDALESKLFGIGSESYVVGNHEFTMAYVMDRQNMALCMDEGHFHPTEFVSPKFSTAMNFIDHGILLHVSRPVRWDSDHVVAFDDETRQLMREIVRLGDYGRTYIATDYFDASINRVMAMTIGARNSKKALLEGFLQPIDRLKKLELEGDLSARMAITEELKAMPLSAVWDFYCLRSGVPLGLEWIYDAKAYEKEILAERE